MQLDEVAQLIRDRLLLLYRINAWPYPSCAWAYATGGYFYRFNNMASEK